MSLFPDNRVAMQAVMLEIDKLEKKKAELNEKREELSQNNADKYQQDLERLKQAYIRHSAQDIEEISREIHNTHATFHDAIVSINRESLSLTTTIAEMRKEEHRLWFYRGPR